MFVCTLVCTLTSAAFGLSCTHFVFNQTMMISQLSLLWMLRGAPQCCNNLSSRARTSSYTPSPSNPLLPMLPISIRARQTTLLIFLESFRATLFRLNLKVSHPPAILASLFSWRGPMTRICRYVGGHSDVLAGIVVAGDTSGAKVGHSHLAYLSLPDGS
jgi:hypothetical protein